MHFALARTGIGVTRGDGVTRGVSALERWVIVSLPV
jgi:hypothetical protein